MRLHLNQNGSLYHFIIPGLILAIGLFTYMTIDFPVPPTKGVWQMSVIRAGIAAEGDVVLIEQMARDAIEEASSKFERDFFTNDYGCGRYDGLSVLAVHCFPQSRGDFLRYVEKNLKFTTIPFLLTYEDGSVIGTAQENKVIVSSASYIPTEERSSGLFETYDAALLKPFLLRYEYNPSFRIQALNPAVGIEEKLLHVRSLIELCQNLNMIESCILTNSEYTLCAEDLDNGKRLVTLCSNETKILVVDLTPSVVLPVTTFDLSNKGSYIEVMFPSSLFADHYTLHYTNAKRVILDLERTRKSAELFADISTTFEEVHGSVLLDPTLCSEEKEMEVAYECDGNVIFKLAKTTIPADYIITITSTHDDKESEIVYFQAIPDDASS